MATLIVSPVASSSEQATLDGNRRRRELKFAVGIVTLLTFFALAVHGYHPYAEDGGPYITGIKHALHSSMYPHWTEFAVPHPRFSFFAISIATLVRLSHLNLEIILLFVHFLSQWLTLFAGWQLATYFCSKTEEKIGAVALLATWLTLPIAGTSILLMDPYVTARSVSTPCGLFALYGILLFQRPLERAQTRRWRGLALCLGALIVAVFIHPLMAAYAFGWVLIFSLQLSRNSKVRRWGTSGLILFAFLLAGTIQRCAPSETQTYLQAEMTRSYWFLSNWTWYEWVGIIAPLAILAVVACQTSEENRGKTELARMAILCSVTAVAISLLFGRIDSVSHVVAWLQPLRILQITYILMTLFLGSALGTHLLKKERLRWFVVFSSLAGIMLFAERQSFPKSAHFEFPGHSPSNPWAQAFLWAKLNTPKEALFALDSDYITKPAEDAQNFRAISERSTLPDSIKDGGDAANNPKLSRGWAAVQTAQKGLSEKSDAQRVAELKPLGVSWIVIERDANTGFSCAYENNAVKICRLPY